ncbi:MAG TPA: flagellar export protein FliJ [Balneolales bacterium]|jgi:flagellar FliJ protein|nr:flagellar export protein FliJ [Balneolales bacterium]
MKKFSFKLEPVLKIRIHEEELQKQAFAREMQQLIGLKGEYDKVQNELEQYSKEYENGNRALLQSPNEYQRHYTFIQSRQQELARLNREIEQAKERTEQERKKLITANQKTRVLENLKERKRVEYLEEADREDQKVMNEIATQRFHRNNM